MIVKDGTMIAIDGAQMPALAAYTWGLQDISAAESGRTDDVTMHKNRVGQKRKLSLTWKILDWTTTSTIMQAVNPTFFDVTYPDMLSGTFETRTFYVGDRSAPVKMWLSGTKMIESVSFDIVER